MIESLAELVEDMTSASEDDDEMSEDESNELHNQQTTKIKTTGLFHVLTFLFLQFKILSLRCQKARNFVIALSKS